MAAVSGSVLLLAWVAHQNMQARGIRSGFDFLLGNAGFEIGESPIAYDSSDSYLYALLVGTLNTLRVAIAGIIAATLIGLLVGIGRLSGSPLLRGACRGYVELFRNVPLVLQLGMWYVLFTELLPPFTEALRLAPGVFVSKNGLTFPIPVWTPGHWGVVAGLGAGLLGAAWQRHQGKRRFERTGRPPAGLWRSMPWILGAALLGWLAGGAPRALDMPHRGAIVIEGGGSLTPEFAALLLGLSLYTAAFIAEIVRAGIQSVPRGQSEACEALGLSRHQELRLVVLPQALRLIIPPLTNQYLNLTKNSSLAVAIGYPDLVSVANTSINQTGRALECISIVMLVYLSLSLATAAIMHAYNQRVAIKER